MTTVKYGHVIFLGHSVNRAEKGQEVLLRVNVLFPVRGKHDVFTFLEMQPLVNIAGLYFRQVLMQDFRHGRTGYVCTFFRHARSVQVSAGMLRIAEVHIGNDVHNTAVGLLRQALVKAAVACLHMEDGDMQTFRAYHAQAGVRVSQHQHGIRFHLHHQLVAGVDNIPHRGTEVIADGIHIHIGVFQLQVTEEDTVQVIVVILAGVGQQTVKITAAFVDDSRQADDFRTGAHYNQKFQSAVLLKPDLRIIQFYIHLFLYSLTRFRLFQNKCPDVPGRNTRCTT